MTVAASLLTIGRFAIRWRKNHRLLLDDWLNAVALIFLLAMIIIFEIYIPIEYNAILYAKGLSNRPTTHLEVERDMKLNIAYILLFFSGIWAVKASFLALYWQIFNSSRGFRKAWCLITAYIAVSYVVTIVTVFTRCGPARYFANIGKSSTFIRTVLWC